ncbi:hypothetical protein FOL47_009825 [Perkinsus chesapeaki]|uniref:Uncharacterized protein n=1 Tax=Perkinsus chesapeaki TaxID=330153 RepID=A0A7J6MRA3_PERCH|nr:hypothetical protein FOL47_009825 [Perkinsus chesapeaki]
MERSQPPASYTTNLDTSSTSAASTTASGSAGDSTRGRGSWEQEKAEHLPRQSPTDSDNKLRHRRTRGGNKLEGLKGRKRRGQNPEQARAAKRTKRSTLEAPKLQLLVERESRQRDPHLLYLRLPIVRQIIAEYAKEADAPGSGGRPDFAGIAGRLAGESGTYLSPEDVQLVVSDFSPHHYRPSLGLVVMERPLQRSAHQMGYYGSVLGTNGHAIARAQAAGSRLRELWRQHRLAMSSPVPVPFQESRPDIRLRVQAAIKRLSYQLPSRLVLQPEKPQLSDCAKSPLLVSNASPPTQPPLTNQLPFKYAGQGPTLKSATLRVVPPRNESKAARKPKPKPKARQEFPGPNLADIQRYQALQYWQSEWLRLGQMAVANSMAMRPPAAAVAPETFNFAARRLLNSADVDDKGLVDGLRRVTENSSPQNTADSPATELAFLGAENWEAADEASGDFV